MYIKLIKGKKMSNNKTAIKLQNEIQVALNEIFDRNKEELIDAEMSLAHLGFAVGSSTASAFYELIVAAIKKDGLSPENETNMWGYLRYINQGYMEKLDILKNPAELEKIAAPLKKH